MKKPFEMCLPSEEEMAAREAARRADRCERSGRDAFNPTNLGHWIDLCQKAGVKYVTAEEIARAPTDELLSFDEKSPPGSVAQFFETVDAEMRRRGDGWMVRWSCCSCADVKYRLGSGNPEWHPDLVSSFHVGDMRAFDLIFEYPEETIAAYARPWVKASILDRFPVEYRVFVSHSRVDGVANYYPQRPLPNSAETLHDIVRCFIATAQLIRAQTKPLNCPPLEKHWDINQNHWTADFIRREDGKILFLEGGPPHTPNGGAHPCCFPAGKTDGVAFAAADEDLERMGLEPRSVVTVADD
jgi:hypothetical protein